ncbi:unnamed protein product [Ostreobium quekettii]|uniref:DNA-directed DNA polymerase n=1 Tax=Ostreobium quekettii TaxID=121088 RepID=A0A8S1IWT3_9CHLO|nr:unnamed protein product [Ostreobium quekettii]
MTRRLEAYLPEVLCSAFRQSGINKDLYDWQAECLCRPGVLDGKNLVYCAPTSGGKSLVAEILMMRQVIATGKACLLVLPFVSLCGEKAAHLERLLAPMHKTVRGFYGSQGGGEIFRNDTGALVCTIEKANMLVCRMIEEQLLDRLCVVVVDELHMVAEDDRGYLLELLLTKLRYATFVNDQESEVPRSEGLQVIGMSATMPNGADVARWLGAELYVTDFRPVPLKRMLLIGRALKDPQMKTVGEVPVDPEWERSDPEHYAWLAKETVDEGHSVLLFCATKKACSDAAKIIAKMVTVPERKIECAANPGQHDRAWIVGELRRLSGSAEAILANVIAKGVAFHHAGLSSEERELVEMAYRCGAISVLAATSTLAAGVNLPARRVIFRHPYMYKDKKKVLLDGTKYRQMSGRAGRAGIDTHGEAILLNSADFSSANMVKLLQEDPKPISSCLSEDRRGMKRAMNEVVASGAVSTPVDVDRFVKCTLLAATSDFQDVVADATKKALHWLGVKQFVRWEGNAYFAPTALGKASLASSLAPDDAIIVKEDLARARQCFVMTTELHLTFLVTPLSELPYINWQALFRLYKSLPECEKKVAELVGANEGYIQKMSHNPPNNSSKDGVVSEPERICERFYAALILHDLIQEVPIDAICEKYEILQGGVQSLQTNSGKFAGMVALFCERLGWLDLEALVAKFQGRVWSGVKPEILALTEIPYVKAARARTLYKAGLRTVDQVAAVESVNSLVAILANGAPHGGIKGDNNDAQLAIERRAAKMILKGARELLVQKAQELKDQAAAAEVIVNQRKRERSMSGSLAVAAKSPSEDPLQAMAEPNAMTPPPSPPPSAQAHKLRLAVESSTGIVTVSDPDDIRHACSFLATLPQFSFDFDATQPPVGAPGPSLELPPGPLGPESDNNQNPQGKPNPHANPNLHLAHTVNGVAFSWTDEHAIYINLRNNENCSQWQFVADVMKGPAEKVAFRLKSQLKAVGAVGESEKRCMNVVAAVDVGIAAWLLQPDEASGFRGCGSGRGSFPTTLEKMLEVHGGRSAVMQACACLNGAKCVGRPAAACKRASMSRKLFGFLAPQLQTQGLLTPLHDVEMPLVPVLVAMEATGMPFDPRICASQRGSLQRRLTELEEKAHRDAGRVFNLTSAQEVAGVLFEDLGLVPPPSAQQGKRGLSTKAEVLQELALEHPLPGLILEHRKLKKLITGFVDSLTGCVCRAGEGASGTEPPRLHGTFLQTSTATGRLSMDEPNLQTVPHPVDYETTASETPPDVLPTGDQPRSSYCFNVRAAFRAPEGWLMLSADYCQLEFRLMAHFSGDESLQQMFRDPGGDPFRLLAAQWLDTPMDEVTEQQRTHAKRLAYGLLYGMGPQALADDLQIPVPAAAQMADAFRASLPGVDAWLRRVVEDCRRTGFVQTIGGRRRYLPDVAERNGGKRGRAERQAVNTLCQGSAADLVKVAMARVHRRIRVEAAGTCHMLLQVHDELLFEVREGALSAVVLLIRAGMERDNGLSVPTPVRLSAGPSWGQLRRL